MKIKIKQLAAQKGISLYKLAKALMLPQQTVYSWASGRTQPNYDNMDILCSALECTMGDLYRADIIPKKKLFDHLKKKHLKHIENEEKRITAARIRLQELME